MKPVLYVCFIVITGEELTYSVKCQYMSKKSARYCMGKCLTMQVFSLHQFCNERHLNIFGFQRKRVSFNTALSLWLYGSKKLVRIFLVSGSMSP